MASNQVVALFAGAGGLSLGFSRAGLKPLAAVELDGWACQTYRLNHSTPCFQHDLSLGLPREVSAPECFALIGGPPCQGFSTAGARDNADPRNRLIFHYLRIVETLKPKWFVFENVEGLLTSNAGQSVADLITEFVALGYWVRLEKINFAAFGLPQGRKRVIIVGNRVGLDFRFPEQTHSFDGDKHRSARGKIRATSVEEAIHGLPNAVGANLDLPYPADGPLTPYETLMRQGNARGTVALHVDETPDSDRQRLHLLKPGQSMKDLPESLWSPSFRSRRFRRVEDGVPSENRGGPPTGIKRLVGSYIALTVTSASTREHGHPSLDRTLTLRECARLQSFPDSYHFAGPRDKVAVQIGNAVPPLAAEILARSIMEWDGKAGTGAAPAAKGAPHLLGYKLTEALAMSPALRATEQRLASISGRAKSVQVTLFDLPEPTPMTKLSLAERKRITKCRTAKPISLSDRELARLVSVMLHDLGLRKLIPSFVEIPKDYRDYYYLSLDWFRIDEHRPFRFDEFYVQCRTEVQDFETLFDCITELHKRRRKFELILRKQPLPTMDQVGRKGLLEFGIVQSPALTSWLVWRKWLYDVDNRSAQETGYLFEPIMAAALGGVAYGARKSPIKRLADSGKGRQVDCLVDAEGERLAYEFKLRMTIAASGQGRWKEELEFPADAEASKFKPMLLVLDPTDSDKLTELVATFKRHGGDALVGSDAWNHIAERAGPTMTAFIERYVRAPITSIDGDANTVLDMHLHLRGQDIEISVGDVRWTLKRAEDVAIDEESDENSAEAG
jgi:DNA (cytosine-5)-methyltransferase 1